MKPEQMLSDAAAELGVMLTKEQVDLFMDFLKLLALWNEKINLTGLKDDRDIIVNHFLDSVTAVSLVRDGSGLLDIGSGAGFPGVPLKIMLPSLRVTLLDSVHKKVVFMKELIKSLSLTDINAVWGRAEDDGNGIERGAFDFVITRAVGKISDIVRLSEPYLAEKGRVIIMRGRRGEEEWKIAEPSVSDRFRLVERKELKLPFGGYSRVIFVLEKS
jgi:16S rRNA (guanine527-N7)-methyltransferase